MAEFGVTTAMVSIFLSIFMAGLGLGSWGAGYLVRRFGARLSFPPLRLCALTELVIGVSALLVPPLFPVLSMLPKGSKLKVCVQFGVPLGFNTQFTPLACETPGCCCAFREGLGRFCDTRRRSCRGRGPW